MKLTTRHFGEIEINENEILHFQDGIPSFEDRKKFIIINNPDIDVPFQWLQGVDDPNLTFVITNPFIFNEEYEFDIPKKVVKELEVENPSDVAIYSITVIPEKTEDITINLQGPIIINTKNRKAKQIILNNEKYPIRYYIFKPISVYGGEG